MKKLLFALISFVFLITMFSFVMAEQSEDNVSTDSVISTANETEENTQTEKNMTYGLCVSEAAKIKNECYASLKEIHSSCKTTAADSTDKKASLKICKSAYKNTKAKCKTDFKSVKQECKKIKHNFLETLKYSFA